MISCVVCRHFMRVVLLLYCNFCSYSFSLQIDVIIQSVRKKNIHAHLLIFFANYQIETPTFNTECTQCVGTFIVELYTTCSFVWTYFCLYLVRSLYDGLQSMVISINWLCSELFLRVIALGLPFKNKSPNLKFF